MSGFEPFIGVLKDNRPSRYDAHPVSRLEINIWSRFGMFHLYGRDDRIEQRTQAGRDQSGLDVPANAIRGDGHRNASKPVTGDVGNSLDLQDQMKVGEKDLVDAFVEILANDGLHSKVCLVGIQKIVWAKPVTRAVPLLLHDQTKRRKSLLDGVQVSPCTVHKSAVAIEDESVERSSFQFKFH